MSAFDRAEEAYDRLVGIDFEKQYFDLYSWCPLRKLVASHQSVGTRSPLVVTVTLSKDSGSTHPKPFESSFIVRSLDPIQRPDDDESTPDKVVYQSPPEWYGNGDVVELSGQGLRVVNRVRFVMETMSDVMPVNVRFGWGLFQFAS